MPQPNNLVKPGIYQHSKSGRLYRVHFTAKHSEDLSDLVVYEALYQNDTSQYWVRPAAMFAEEIELNGRRVPRFVFVRDA